MKKNNNLRWLAQQKIAYDTVEYQYDTEDLSVQTIAETNQLEIRQIFKTLVLMGDKNAVLVALVAGHRQISLKKLAQASGHKKVFMAPQKDLEALTGYVRGGCCPIGMKQRFPVFADESIQNLPWVYVNAGERGLLFGCAPIELLRIAQATCADICEADAVAD